MAPPEAGDLGKSAFLRLPVLFAADNYLTALDFYCRNQMSGGINQTQHEAIAEALADRSRLVDGKPTSLLDLGYDRIGMACHSLCMPRRRWSPAWHASRHDATPRDALHASGHRYG